MIHAAPPADVRTTYTYMRAVLRARGRKSCGYELASAAAHTSRVDAAAPCNCFVNMQRTKGDVVSRQNVNETSDDKTRGCVFGDT